jgi:hypothetical protein
MGVFSGHTFIGYFKKSVEMDSQKGRELKAVVQRPEKEEWLPGMALFSPTLIFPPNDLTCVSLFEK